VTHCARCGRELPTTLDEYGPDLHAPLCVVCWEADETQGVDRATWLTREEAAQAVLVLEAERREQRELGL